MKQHYFKFFKALLVSIFSLLSISAIYAQEGKIQGKIIDDVTKLPLEGVTVKSKASNYSVITNANGEFSVNAPKNSELIITYIGYGEKKIVASDNFSTVGIVPRTGQLEEVVVTALGVKKETKRLGYTVQEVKGADLTKARESNPINGLTGKVAGLNVGINQEILASPTVLLRGSPLNFYVVDGIPINSDTWNISPDDIETYTVLKGPTAAALYGTFSQL